MKVVYGTLRAFQTRIKVEDNKTACDGFTPSFLRNVLATVFAKRCCFTLRIANMSSSTNFSEVDSAKTNTKCLCWSTLLTCVDWFIKDNLYRTPNLRYREYTNALDCFVKLSIFQEVLIGTDIFCLRVRNEISRCKNCDQVGGVNRLEKSQWVKSTECLICEFSFNGTNVITLKRARKLS